MVAEPTLKTVTQVVASEEDMVGLGMQLGQHSGCVGTIFLQGELGVGKTTFVRGLLQGKGYAGAVKSPTYSLILSYQLPAGVCYHLDLYRLSTTDESEFPGLRDLLTEPALILIEWPERISGGLFQPDVCVQMSYGMHKREIVLQACTQIGNNFLFGLSV